MRFRWLQVPALLICTLWLAGCGGSYSGVQATAPGPVDQLVQRSPGNGQFTLYKASGFNDLGQPRKIERLWTVSLSEGQNLGFKWGNDPARAYTPNAGAQLEAFAGRETRDLGAFRDRDVKYLWAGAQADLGGYFQSVANRNMLKTATMQ